METARDDDPELASFGVVVSALLEALGANNHVTTGELKDLAEKGDTITGGDGEYSDRYGKRLDHPELHHALLDVAGVRGAINSLSLGKFLSRHAHKISDGVKLCDATDRHKKQKTWYLARVSRP